MRAKTEPRGDHRRPKNNRTRTHFRQSFLQSPPPLELRLSNPLRPLNRRWQLAQYLANQSGVRASDLNDDWVRRGYEYLVGRRDETSAGLAEAARLAEYVNRSAKD